MKRRLVLCVGNRFAGTDDAGPRVYDRLSRLDLPPGIEVVDGGVGGLSLLPLVEGAERVVFVDTLEGYGPRDEPVVLEGGAAVRDLEPAYGHGEGFAYLLKVLPDVTDGPPPAVRVAGVGAGASQRAIEELAGIALRLAGAPAGEEGGHGR